MTTAPSHPRPDRPQQPWLHEYDVCVHGTLTCVSAPDGELGRPGTGVYADDRRVLATTALTWDGRAADRLASTSLGPVARHHLMLRHLGTPGADPTVSVRRTRTLLDTGLREEIEVSSQAEAEVVTELRLELGGDGADLGAVKGGRERGAALAAEVDGDTLRWSDARHRTTLTAPGAELTALPGGGGALTWRLRVPPGASVGVVLSLAVERVEATTFDSGPGSHLVDWSGFSVSAVDGRLGPVVDNAVADLAGLLQSDPEAPGDAFAAAGSPWYLTLFGRDALWTARLALPLGTDLARGTLAALARRQGTVTDAGTGEQPGKILHEVRRSSYDDHAGLLLPPVYFGTIDATALWVSLLHEAWLWGLPDEEVRALRVPLERAIGWLQTCVADSDDGFLRYHDETGRGLANQGWKDSGDSMRTRDGRVADAPIALVEPQAYAVEAALRAADLAAALFTGGGGGDGGRGGGGAGGAGVGGSVLADGGDGLRAWAGELAARLHAAFWVSDAAGPYLAMALDSDGAPVDGVGSNMGHVLGTGALDERESALVAARLGGPDLLGPFGIGTLGRGNPAFNPVGYHTGSIWTHDTAVCARGLAAAGDPGAAGRAVRGLLDAATHFDYRLPELFGGDVGLGRPVPYPASCRPQAWSAASAVAMVSTALGLSVDVPRRRLRVEPLRPAPFGALEVHGIRVGDDLVSVRTGADGAVLDVRAPDWLEVSVG